jgi:hypothetical protein
MLAAALVLAQSAPTVTQENARAIWFWLLVIVIAAAAVVVLAMVLRRKLLGGDETPDQPFTLGELRRLKAEGKLTEEEFARARAGIIAHSSAVLATDDKADAKSERPRSADGLALDRPADGAPETPGDNPDSDNGEGPEARDERQ